jgi:alpha-1,3-mannosyltransferase
MMMIRELLVNRKYYWHVAALILCVDAALNVLIVEFVGYTEIDWRAYMEEVGGALEGNLDYEQLQGDTGPLVYPGGFVYLYAALHWLTDGGDNIRLAQHVFCALHVLFLAVVFGVLYETKRVDAWMLPLAVFSRRIHSVFVLRLFNDCWAMLLAYGAVLLFARRRWTLGMLVFSLGVSIKMNVLLFAPGLLVLLAEARGGWLRALPAAALAAAIQLAIGAPFLAANWQGYVARSFNVGRRFFFVWTVNWKFVPEWLFVSDAWSALTLAAHLVALVAFAHRHWSRLPGGFLALLAPLRDAATPPPTPEHIVRVLLTSNFIGIVFARSLHYQFYSWYFHSLAFLCLVAARMHAALAVALLVAIEIAWNCYPSTPLSSALLATCHLFLLYRLWSAPSDKTKES